MQILDGKTTEFYSCSAMDIFQVPILKSSTCKNQNSELEPITFDVGIFTRAFNSS